MCLVIQSCTTLFDPLGYSPPGSSVHEIFQAKVLERLLFPSPGGPSDPGIKPMFPVASLPSGKSRTGHSMNDNNNNNNNNNNKNLRVLTKYNT